MERMEKRIGPVVDPDWHADYQKGFECALFSEYNFPELCREHWLMERVWDSKHETYWMAVYPHKCKCPHRWDAHARATTGSPLIRARKKLKLPSLYEKNHEGYSQQWKQKYGCELCPECFGIRRRDPLCGDTFT